MSRKNIFYIIFFSILVVGFFVVLSFVVPGFTSQKFPPLSTVQPFAFTNQEGKLITEKDVAGKVQAVNFFFTTCRTVCPKMTNNLKPIFEEYKNEPGFVILSYTSDPERDSVAVLKNYADSIHATADKWIFLTGRKDSLYKMARHSYTIDDPKNFVEDINDDFLHTQLIALVNRKGEVVRVYDGIKPSEMKQMSEDIKTLLKD